MPRNRLRFFFWLVVHSISVVQAIFAQTPQRPLDLDKITPANLKNMTTEIANRIQNQGEAKVSYQAPSGEIKNLSLTRLSGAFAGTERHTFKAKAVEGSQNFVLKLAKRHPGSHARSVANMKALNVVSNVLKSESIATDVYHSTKFYSVEELVPNFRKNSLSAFLKEMKKNPESVEVKQKARALKTFFRDHPYINDNDMNPHNVGFTKKEGRWRPVIIDSGHHTVFDLSPSTESFDIFFDDPASSPRVQKLHQEIVSIVSKSRSKLRKGLDFKTMSTLGREISCRVDMNAISPNFLGKTFGIGADLLGLIAENPYQESNGLSCLSANSEKGKLSCDVKPSDLVVAPDEIRCTVVTKVNFSTYATDDESTQTNCIFSYLDFIVSVAKREDILNLLKSEMSGGLLIVSPYSAATRQPQRAKEVIEKQLGLKVTEVKILTHPEGIL